MLQLSQWKTGDGGCHLTLSYIQMFIGIKAGFCHSVFLVWAIGSNKFFLKKANLGCQSKQREEKSKEQDISFIGDFSQIYLATLITGYLPPIGDAGTKLNNQVKRSI